MHFNDLDRARVFALDAVVVNFDPALDWWFLVAQAGDQRGRHRSCFLLPRQPSRLGRSGLLIQLRLECGPGVGGGHGGVVVVGSGVDYAASRADLISSVVSAALIAS